MMISVIVMAISVGILIGITICVATRQSLQMMKSWQVMQAWWALNVTHRMEASKLQHLFDSIKLPIQVAWPGDQAFDLMAWPASGVASFISYRNASRYMAIH